MKTKHSIYDTDTHFTVDPVNRVMTNEGSTKNILIQGDHNSERFTFALPRTIEGHDLSLCDSVQVHYNNIDATTKAESRGVYEVDDMQISPDGDDTVICSWLISGNATKYVGVLGFLLRFTCITDKGVVTYIWNTAVYNKITVSDGLYNGEVVVEEYADILAEWERELKANQVVRMVQTKVATEDDGLNVWTAEMGDGRTYSFEVRNGSRGPTGFIGSIETVDGRPLRFFAGTQAEYDALPESTKKGNLFAIISDDPAGANIKTAISNQARLLGGLADRVDGLESDMEDRVGGLESDMGGLKDGSVKVSHADKADVATYAGGVANIPVRIVIPSGSTSKKADPPTFKMGCSYALSVYEHNVAAINNHRGTSYILDIPSGLATGDGDINVVQSTLSITLRKKADGSGEFEELSWVKVQLYSDGFWGVSIERRTFSGTTVENTKGATIVARTINIQ